MSSFIVYNNLLSKNYLNLSYAQINSPTHSRWSLSFLARAIFKKELILLKKIKNNYNAFDAMTVILLSVTSTSHSTESPGVNSKSFTISLGTPTRNEFDLLFAIPTLDLYLNIIIPLLSFYIVINMLVRLYKSFLFKYYLKRNLKGNLYILRS